MTTVSGEAAYQTGSAGALRPKLTECGTPLAATSLPAQPLLEFFARVWSPAWAPSRPGRYSIRIIDDPGIICFMLVAAQKVPQSSTPLRAVEPALP